MWFFVSIFVFKTVTVMTVGFEKPHLSKPHPFRRLWSSRFKKSDGPGSLLFAEFDIVMQWEEPRKSSAFIYKTNIILKSWQDNTGAGPHRSLLGKLNRDNCLHSKKMGRDRWRLKRNLLLKNRWLLPFLDSEKLIRSSKEGKKKKKQMPSGALIP